ncbi:glycosyltransferase family A protein [Psychroflexus tropicus]|uniref:glycosyltransferase family A protein n=1 Tax=Psychroflexus tropicus TaxID=197345 RepID=UPI001FE1809F|nr:glycosyltransferase family 2 protein [Psychroflexus tropicus]
MNRKDLSFVDAMFPVLDLSRYRLLIINQTRLEEDLISNVEGIRVINSREFGLSKSRNLGIENASGDILLIADDDIEYLPDFDKTILEAYQTYNEASLISFQFLADRPEYMKCYPKKDGYTKSRKQSLTSFEISFLRADIQSNKIIMNENFGLGAVFPSAEEQVFKDDVLKKGLKIAYVAKPIVKHFGKTTGYDQSDVDFIRAITAQKFLSYGTYSYLWLFKFVFFLYRHRYISFFEQVKAYQTGMRAILEIKEINNESKL